MARHAAQLALVSCDDPPACVSDGADRHDTVNAVVLGDLAVGDSAAVCVREESLAYASGAGFSEGQPVSQHPMGLLPVAHDPDLRVNDDLARRFHPHELADALARECLAAACRRTP
jgi:hypothetical protein